MIRLTLAAATALLLSSTAYADEYITVYVPDGYKAVLVPEDAPEVLVAIELITTEEVSSEPKEECSGGLTLGGGDPCSKG